MKPLSIAIDMDEVITDTLAKRIDLINALLNRNLCRADFFGVDGRNHLTEAEWERVFEHENSKGFFRDLAVRDGDTIPVLRRLCERYDVYICTAAMDAPNSFEDKFLWLKEHAPFISPRQIIFCGRKHFLGTDYMVDDNLSQLSGFHGRRILYTAPHNVHYRGDDMQRVNSWADIYHQFLGSTVITCK